MSVWLQMCINICAVQNIKVLLGGKGSFHKCSHTMLSLHLQSIEKRVSLDRLVLLVLTGFWIHKLHTQHKSSLHGLKEELNLTCFLTNLTLIIQI